MPEKRTLRYKHRPPEHYAAGAFPLNSSMKIPWICLIVLKVYERKIGQLSMEVDFLEKKCAQLGIPGKGRS